MPATSSMQRLWLVVLCLLAAAVSLRAEVLGGVFVAHGAEVVLEVLPGKDGGEYYQYSYLTSSGINWPFYREPVSRRAGNECELLLVENCRPGHLLRYMRFSERRISLFIPDDFDCTIVTLDLAPEGPQVRTDKFVNAHGFGGQRTELLGADELELSDDYAPWRHPPRRLLRDNEGTWHCDGAPYRTCVESHVSAVPLPAMPVEKRQPGADKAGSMAGNSARHEAALRTLTQPAAAGWDKVWRQPSFVSGGYGFFYFPGLPAELFKDDLLDSLRSIRAGIGKPRTLLAPEMEVGQEFDLPGYHSWHSYIKLIAENGMTEFEPFHNRRHDWFTDDDLALPCFAMNYHRVVRDIGLAYDRWKGWCELHLLESLSGPDDPVFFSVIEWHMNRPER